MTKFITIVLVLGGLAICSACQPAANSAAGVEPTTAVSPTAAAATDSTTITPTAAPFDRSDPFAYCANVRTIDQPDEGYTGEAKPESVIQGLMKAAGVSADMPMDVFGQGSFWRCMDGKVYGCFVGANLPCDSKADTSNTATPEMDAYCQANPTAEFVPAAVSGHATVYEWKCQAGKAVAGDQVFQVDAQGYISEIWYAIEP